MAQLYFRYGAMNASKSIQLLTVAHNYEQSGKKVMVFTPAVDDRFGVGKVASRVGISREAYPITDETDLYEIVAAEELKPHCVLVDEAQFIGKHHVDQLVAIVDKLGIPVIVYGLLKNFKNELFPGSAALLCEADKVEEIKTVCVYCNKKATHILKFKNGKPVYAGETIEIAGNDTYSSVCRRHYYHPPGF
ncbi:MULTISPECIES: thymidine kinase [Brevibacillus]|uniref:Thymidine kinase n=2 Tax=Brevibacillus TaxID=55080 RepID=A0A1I3UUU1_9BACL|nr:MULTISPECIES: thymidine kinase [Brevibacillus]MEC2130445.1 thymidine kinase [Brevibacillus centrosporus]MED1791200.1 thymidine kinase [Brevibacillus nitrificans]MED1952261.1 thymidine kinase [Brevibacillus centrosporus]MED4911406.1 thymidine kinase [Brevibacillus centrosporus]RNB68953.1 thymidine kinase [Brevibacillus centrosporus]